VPLGVSSFSHECSSDALDEGRLRDLIESRTIKIGAEEYRLRLVGLSETPNNAVLLAIAIGDIDERLQLHLSEGQRRHPILLRQRIVYFAKRIVTTARLSHSPTVSQVVDQAHPLFDFAVEGAEGQFA